MYTCQHCYVKTHEPRARWLKQEDISQPLFLYYTDYRAVSFVLTHPFSEEVFLLDLDDIPKTDNPTNSLLTIQAYLDQFGNQTLPVRPFDLKLDALYATFTDANQAWFDIEPVNTAFHYEVPLPRDEKPDLRLTQPKRDYERLFKTSLMSVNGLLHQTNYTGNSVNILEGACSAQHANRFQVGIYSFAALGEVTTVPVRQRHIDRIHPERPLSDTVYLDIDPRVGSLEGKSLLLSIGGYLHLVGHSPVWRYGPHALLIDFKNYPWVHRFHEMDRLLNLYCFRTLLERGTKNNTQVTLESLYSDASIRALFSMSQTFVVVVDTPQLFVERLPVESAQLAGRYISYEKPRYPLMAGLNKFYEYWTRFEYDRYVLSIDDPWKAFYLHDTTDRDEKTSIDTSREPKRIKEHTQAFFYKLGKPVLAKP